MSGVLGLIPARGGSKSIPGKNVAPLGGRPLMAWCARAALAAKAVDRVALSTDDATIAAVGRELGLTIIERPAELAGDDAPVVAAMIHALDVLRETDGFDPWAVALFQPTSPFVTPEQADGLLSLLEGDPAAMSAQTVAKPPHNHHAFNQRVIEEGRVRFKFPEERAACYNKQRKPALYVFGNLVATRASALRQGLGVFADPSLALEIEAPYALDVDGPADFPLAEYYLGRGLLKMPHMNQGEVR